MILEHPKLGRKRYQEMHRSSYKARGGGNNKVLIQKIKKAKEAGKEFWR